MWFCVVIQVLDIRWLNVVRQVLPIMKLHVLKVFSHMARRDVFGITDRI